MKCETCGKEYSPDCDYKQGRCPNHPPLISMKSITGWLERNIYELNFCVAGWCAAAAFHSALDENYILALINLAFVYFNVKMAQSNKE